MTYPLLHAVVNAYVPNAGEGLKRLEYRLNGWDIAFSERLAALGKKKPVVLAGDLNCAPQPVDIHNPRRSESPPCTPIDSSFMTACSTIPHQHAQDFTAMPLDNST